MLHSSYDLCSYVFILCFSCVAQLTELIKMLLKPNPLFSFAIFLSIPFSVNHENRRMGCFQEMSETRNEVKYIN